MIPRVKYKVLPAKSIVNLCGPECDPIGWTPEIIEQRKQKTIKRLQRANTKVFFQKLEESILKEGFRNPIVVATGVLSEAYKEFEPQLNYSQLSRRLPPDVNPLKAIICHEYGGSRLWIAQKHNLDIPCIVNDFADLIDGQQLGDDAAILAHFQDKPNRIVWHEHKVTIGQLPHVHMDANQ